MEEVYKATAGYQNIMRRAKFMAHCWKGRSSTSMTTSSWAAWQAQSTASTHILNGTSIG